MTFKAAFAVSDDGSFLIYEGESSPPQLWYRALGTREAYPITGTEGGWFPMISPGGERIAFIQNNELITSFVDGGGRLRLAEVGRVDGGAWLPDGRLMLMDRDGMYARWFDGETEVRSGDTDYCTLPDPLTSVRLSLCCESVTKTNAICYEHKSLSST